MSAHAPAGTPGVVAYPERVPENDPRPLLPLWVALLAAVGCGAFKNIEQACAATIRVVSRTAHDKKAAQQYDRGFPLYQQLYRSLKEDFQAISRL